MADRPNLADIARGRESLRIDIRRRGAVIGELVPVTDASLGDAATIELLTRWRNRARDSFLTRFESTPERTARWLRDVVLPDPRRLLLLLRSTVAPIGQYGFKNLGPDSVELDNLIRGERGGDPALVFHAEAALVAWLFASFPVRRIVAYVLADNELALDLHREAGFVATDRLPLEPRSTADGTALVVGAVGGSSSAGLYYQKMELDRTRFTQGTGT